MKHMTVGIFLFKSAQVILYNDVMVLEGHHLIFYGFLLWGGRISIGSFRSPLFHIRRLYVLPCITIHTVVSASDKKQSVWYLQDPQQQGPGLNYPSP